MAFRLSTTSARPAYTKKNHKGASFKHIAPRNDESDSGGGKEVHAKAKRIHNLKPGIGLPKGHGPESYEKKNHRGGSFKTVAPRAQNDAGAGARLERATAIAIRGKRLDEWARGKRKHY